MELIANNSEITYLVARGFEDLGNYTKADEFWLIFAIQKFEGKGLGQGFKRTCGHNSEVGEMDDKFLYHHIAKRAKHGNVDLRKEGIVTQFVYNSSINKG
ncbi:MAG: hypothetical protein QME12_08550, partial [Nanoarchaeota archaeon]|nr:hypothetical protein [Nanoarchaeota archaeon]